ncbi:MAG: VPLPA-CTERM sorting domain-containing protein [Rhizobiaceae bacterium]
MFENRKSAVIAAIVGSIGFLAGVSSANAVTIGTISSTGAGSAVTTVSASADFENQASLNGNPYVEDGISFSRTNTSFSNNGCGYAGCGGHSGFFSGPTQFSGNYLYGTGTNGYFDITATGSNLFNGLELILGTGHGPSGLDDLVWETFVNGSSVSSGIIFNIASLPAIFGWSDVTGFDQLRISTGRNLSLGFTGFHTTAIDSVKAQYGSVSAVPVPAALPLLGTGLAVMGLVGWRRKRKAG